MKITHVTSVHPRFDTRIFHKMCLSAVMSGHQVSLVVADGNGNDIVDGVAIYDVGKPMSRISRILSSGKRVLSRAYKTNSDVYHLHDPELLLHSVFFKTNATVLVDFHEDVRLQIQRKEYIGRSLRKLVSFLYGIVEKRALKRFSGILGATQPICDIYQDKLPTELVRNYPKLDEFKSIEKNYDRLDSFNLVYVGGITKARGLGQLIDVLDLLEHPVSLHLCGPIPSKDFANYLKAKKGWEKVIHHGVVNRKKVVEILSQADLGFVTLLPDPSYEVALPVKMFEYFASATPVLASNFPMWQEILEEDGSGLVVDPLNVLEIASVVNLLLQNTEGLKRFGKNGQLSAERKYSWDLEYQKLEKFYEKCRELDKCQ